MGGETIAFTVFIVLQFVVIVLTQLRIRELERYLMNRQDPGAYVSTRMPASTFATHEPPSSDDQTNRDLTEYGRLILGGVATTAQILAHEAKYGTKEDIL